MNFRHIRVSDLILVEPRTARSSRANGRSTGPRSPSTRRCTRPGPTSSPPRTRTRMLRQVVVVARAAARPDHPGRVRVLRGPRAVRRLHRRRARPRGGQAHRPTRSATTRPSSCATTACSPSATRSTRRCGGSSRWSARARRSCSPRRRATPVLIDARDGASSPPDQVGSHVAGYFSFQPLYEKIVREQPDLLD